MEERNNSNDKIFTQKSDMQSSCSPPTGQCPASPPCPTPLWFIISSWLNVIWNISLARIDQLVLALSHPSSLCPSVPSLAEQYKKLKHPQVCAALLSNSCEMLVCYWHCFSHKTKTQHLIRHCEENKLCPSWNQDSCLKWIFLKLVT